MSDLMSFLQPVLLAFGVVVFGALPSFGFYAGVMIASHYLGPLRITMNRERIDVHVQQESK